MVWAKDGAIEIGGERFMWVRGEVVPNFLPEHIIDEALTEGFIVIEVKNEPKAQNAHRRKRKRSK